MTANWFLLGVLHTHTMYVTFVVSCSLRLAACGLSAALVEQFAYDADQMNGRRLNA